MGSWGYGILQNDTAQDGICDVIHRIERDISNLPATPSRDTAARLAAGIALLLQLSPYSFDPENDFRDKLMLVLAANRHYFAQLPRTAEGILGAILDGRGQELASRDGDVDLQIDTVLHSDENEGFIMQKTFSAVETDLLQHPISIAYLQRIVDSIVEMVNKGFSDEQMLDLSREAYFIGQVGLLLVLPQCHVDPNNFKQWQDRFTKLWGKKSTDNKIESEFDTRYNANIVKAFKCGIERFSENR